MTCLQNKNSNFEYPFLQSNLTFTFTFRNFLSGLFSFFSRSVFSKMKIKFSLCLNLIFILQLFKYGHAVECYQCASSEDPKGEDNCGAYVKFDKNKHFAIDCSSEESHMPGTFCMKVTQQSPKGFIWDGRWRQVIRRCASVADTGVTGVCNWGVYDNGVYWEECYCSENGCNTAEYNSVSKSLVVLPLFVVLGRIFW